MRNPREGRRLKSENKVTGEQLRDDIDAGRTADKVPFPDPAAAPLATDAEAGGVSTDFPSERRQIPQMFGKGWGGLIIYLGVTALIGLCATLIIWSAT